MKKYEKRRKTWYLSKNGVQKSTILVSMLHPPYRIFTHNHIACLRNGLYNIFTTEFTILNFYINIVFFLEIPYTVWKMG